MARKQRRYDTEYKVQAVKLAEEMDSCKRAADELVQHCINLLVILNRQRYSFIRPFKRFCRDIILLYKM